MKIVIVGLGKFGKTITKSLSEENHDIIVIDNNSKIVDSMVNEYDVLGFCGNGASYETQNKASVDKADVLIASTSSDEVNILCCLTAKKMGAKKTIARIRNPEYSLQSKLMMNDFGIDLCVNPDLSTAREMFKILRFPSALKVESFAEGKVNLVEIKIDEDSELIGNSLIQIKKKYDVSLLACAIKRDDKVIIPDGKFIVEANDYIYAASSSNEIAKDFKALNIFNNKTKSSLIVGGSRIAYYLANMLTKNGVSVKIIESDQNKCISLTESLKDAMIINGDGTNYNLLREEGIDTVDSLITLTGMDENNMVISTFAQSTNCKKIITKVNNNHYSMILKKLDLDCVISPKDVLANEVVRYVRGMSSNKSNQFLTLYQLVDGEVEASEFLISAKSSYTSIPIKDLNLKENTLIVSIIRDNKVIIPGGNDTLEVNDRVVIVTDEQINDIDDILEN